MIKKTKLLLDVLKEYQEKDNRQFRASAAFQFRRAGKAEQIAQAVLRAYFQTVDSFKDMSKNQAAVSAVMKFV